MTIISNASLKPYNTFGVDAKTAHLAEITTAEELKEALSFAKNNQLKVLFLGGGSNILFTKDFDGLVIVLNLKGISEQNFDDNFVLVTAKAGENWHQFVQYCIAKNYGGLENLSLIPGNVGTSPMQNIGAYGTEIKDYFYSCKVLNINTLETETFNTEKCQFGYRESFFKKRGKGKYVILEVTFKLTKNNHRLSVEYGAIKSELEKMGVQEPTIQDISQAVIHIRSQKLPNPKELGNAGSFFKNPVIPMSVYEPLKKLHPEIPGYYDGKWVKVPAGWLIEHDGWKGKKNGNVATHQHQALVIVNLTGEATGKEIFDFSTQIIESVKKNFGIELEREVNII